MKHHILILIARADAVYGGRRPAAVRRYYFYVIRDIQQQAGELMKGIAAARQRQGKSLELRVVMRI
jgi:hypothetical protein